MASAVTIVVLGLGGPRCTIEATDEWTVQQVHELLYEMIDVQIGQQITLCQGTEVLALEATIGSMVDDPAQGLKVTLVVEEDKTEPGALLEAIRRPDEAAALSLLRRPRLPGLNQLNEATGGSHGYGSSVLHEAVALPAVALAILARPDFTAVNAKGYMTALHEAAWKRSIPICQAILARPDLTDECRLEDSCAMTRERLASEFAEGYPALHELLKNAEDEAARRLGFQSGAEYDHLKLTAECKRLEDRFFAENPHLAQLWGKGKGKGGD